MYHISVRMVQFIANDSARSIIDTRKTLLTLCYLKLIVFRLHSIKCNQTLKTRFLWCVENRTVNIFSLFSTHRIYHHDTYAICITNTLWMFYIYDFQQRNGEMTMWRCISKKPFTLVALRHKTHVLYTRLGHLSVNHEGDISEKFRQFSGYFTCKISCLHKNNLSNRFRFSVVIVRLSLKVSKIG